MSDRRLVASTDGTNVDYYDADVTSTTEYYPYGMTLRSETDGSNYRYGFQGQEMDDEVKGEGNSVNYKYRMHDPRIGRFFAVDPLDAQYPYYTPYSFSGNRVIDAFELEGLEPFRYHQSYMDKDGFTHTLEKPKIFISNAEEGKKWALKYLSASSGFLFETTEGVEQVQGIYMVDDFTDGLYNRTIYFLSEEPGEFYLNKWSDNVLAKKRQRLPLAAIVNYKTDQVFSNYSHHVKVDLTNTGYSRAPNATAHVVDITVNGITVSAEVKITKIEGDVKLSTIQEVTFSKKVESNGNSGGADKGYLVQFWNGTHNCLECVEVRDPITHKVVEKWRSTAIMIYKFDDKEEYIKFLDAVRDTYGEGIVPDSEDIE